MIEYLISYIAFSAITLFTLYWGLTFIGQVKHGDLPRFKVKLNPVEAFERKKMKDKVKSDILNNG